MRLRALITDDEPLARERLRFLLSNDEDIEIAGECRNGREAVAAIRGQQVDVLFLDVQMPGSTGFDVIDQIGTAHVPVIVFVTAHNHYALQAFKVHALDYLTKPIEPERLHATLERVKQRIASNAALQTHEQLKTMLASLENSLSRPKEYLKRLLIHNGTKDYFINVDDIEWIEAADYYSCLHVGTRNLMLRETIKQLATNLNPQKFVRIHRSTIVNVSFVREIVREGQSEGLVLLSNGKQLKMSKAGWQNLLAVSQMSTRD